MSKNRGASKIFFRWLKSSQTVSFDGRPSVLELAISAQLPLEHSCGGMGTCGTCRVLVCSDVSQLPNRNDIEREISVDREFSASERLACQLEAFDGLSVEIPKTKKV